MSPTLTNIIHYAVVTVMTVAAFGPELPAIHAFLPANAYHALAVACGVALWLSQSPLLKPWFSNPVLEKKQAIASLRPGPITEGEDP